jgi:hypothetical protein
VRRFYLSIGVILGFLILIILSFLVFSILSLFISWGINFTTGYEIGFWRTFVGLYIIWLVARLIIPSNGGRKGE